MCLPLCVSSLCALPLFLCSFLVLPLSFFCCRFSCVSLYVCTVCLFLSFLVCARLYLLLLLYLAVLACCALLPLSVFGALVSVLVFYVLVCVRCLFPTCIYCVFGVSLVFLSYVSFGVWSFSV